MVENSALIQWRERVVGRGETSVRKQVGNIIGDLSKGKGEKELFGFEVGQLEHEIELRGDGAQERAGIVLSWGEGKVLEAFLRGEARSPIEGLKLVSVQNLQSFLAWRFRSLIHATSSVSPRHLDPQIVSEGRESETLVQYVSKYGA